MSDSTLFYILLSAMGSLTLAGVVLMLLTKNLVHAGFALFVVLVGLAGVYVTALADFAAITQIIVYVGGILILLLFGVMLSNRQYNTAPPVERINTVAGIGVSVILLFLLLYVFNPTVLASTQNPNLVVDAQNAANSIQPKQQFTDVQQFGITLMTRYLIPFELSSFFLLAALIIAATITRSTQLSFSANETQEPLD